MNNPKRFLLICLLCMVLPGITSSLLAQRKGYASIGVGSGMYFGDISDTWDNNEFLPALTLQVGKYVAPGVSIRGSFTQGTVGASDARSKTQARWQRNLSFRTHISEVQVGGVYEFLEDKSFRQRWKRDIHISPMVFAGVSGMYMNPTTYYQGDWIKLQPLGTEGQYVEGNDTKPYSRFQFAVPAGFGLTVRLPSHVAIWAEVGYRKTFTDYLDDVSTTYPNSADLVAASGQMAGILSDRSAEQFPIGSPRGNPTAKDAFLFCSFGVGYFLGR